MHSWSVDSGVNCFMNKDSWPCPNKELRYDKGENRKKHLSLDADAMMVNEHGQWVGHCPRRFAPETALDLLQHGIPEFRESIPEKPCRIWSYHDGVIYSARSDTTGAAWHGFPCGYPMLRQLPSEIKNQLEKRAIELGEQGKFNKWLKKRWGE